MSGQSNNERYLMKQDLGGYGKEEEMDSYKQEQRKQRLFR